MRKNLLDKITYYQRKKIVTIKLPKKNCEFKTRKNFIRSDFIRSDILSDKHSDNLFTFFVLFLSRNISRILLINKNIPNFNDSPILKITNFLPNIFRKLSLNIFSILNSFSAMRYTDRL